VYVANSLNGTVSVIDASTYTIVESTILVEGNPQDLEMSPDGAKVYVSNFNSASVSVIDTASNTVQATIPVGFFPHGMDTTPAGETLYVVDDGSVAVIDTATNTLSGRVTLPPFHTSRDVAVTPDGTRGYVTINTPQRVLVFDTATNALVGDPIPIEDGIPEGIAITPAPATGTVPFASIDAKLNVRPHSRYALSAAGTFVVSDTSDGIQPASEVVRLTLSSAQGSCSTRPCPSAR
jgi:YVTN family beta-propeller protein